MMITASTEAFFFFFKFYFIFFFFFLLFVVLFQSPICVGYFQVAAGRHVAAPNAPIDGCDIFELTATASTFSTFPRAEFHNWKAIWEADSPDVGSDAPGAGNGAQRPTIILEIQWRVLFIFLFYVHLPPNIINTKNQSLDKKKTTKTKQKKNRIKRDDFIVIVIVVCYQHREWHNRCLTVLPDNRHGNVDTFQCNQFNWLIYSMIDS